MVSDDCAGECGNKECPFLHIDPEKKIKVCPWYDRGFCRHGNYGCSTCNSVLSVCLLQIKLECGPMPNVMAALPNTGGAPCSTPQSLAVVHY